MVKLQLIKIAFAEFQRNKMIFARFKKRTDVILQTCKIVVVFAAQSSE